MKFNFQVSCNAKKLITNIKSALSRITETEEINSSSPEISTEEEAQGLIHLIKTEGLIFRRKWYSLLP